MTPGADTVHLRPPRPSDATALAALAGELGYPTNAGGLLGRLAAVHPTDAAVIVAADAADQPTGWCHVELHRTLVEPLSGLIVGLVIGEGHRSAGIGAGCWRPPRSGRALVAVRGCSWRPGSRANGRIASMRARGTK